MFKFKKLVVSAFIALGLSSSLLASDHITKQDVLNAEKIWGDAIVAIGNAYSSNKDYKKVAEKVVDELYAYDEGIVLFKPKKPLQNSFVSMRKMLHHILLQVLFLKIMDLQYNHGAKYDLKIQVFS